jgi:hypothetical protein
MPEVEPVQRFCVFVEVAVQYAVAAELTLHPVPPFHWQSSVAPVPVWHAAWFWLADAWQ